MRATAYQADPGSNILPGWELEVTVLCYEPAIRAGLHNKTLMLPAVPSAGLGRPQSQADCCIAECCANKRIKHVLSPGQVATSRRNE